MKLKSSISNLYPSMWVCDTYVGLVILHYNLGRPWKIVCVENKVKIHVLLIQTRWYLNKSCTSPKRNLTKISSSSYEQCNMEFGPSFPKLTVCKGVMVTGWCPFDSKDNLLFISSFHHTNKAKDTLYLFPIARSFTMRSEHQHLVAQVGAVWGVHF